MTEWEKEFILKHRIARMATVTPNHQPHVLPIVYAFDGQHLFTPIDKKPKRADIDKLQRVRNIQANNQVAVIIDDYGEDWQQLAWVQLRGWAVILTEGKLYETGIQLLNDKYPQYETMPLEDRPLIVITAEKIISWRANQ